MTLGPVLVRKNMNKRRDLHEKQGSALKKHNQDKPSNTIWKCSKYNQRESKRAILFLVTGSPQLFDASRACRVKGSSRDCANDSVHSYFMVCKTSFDDILMKMWRCAFWSCNVHPRTLGVYTVVSLMMELWSLVVKRSWALVVTGRWKKAVATTQWASCSSFVWHELCCVARSMQKVPSRFRNHNFITRSLQLNSALKHRLRSYDSDLMISYVDHYEVMRSLLEESGGLLLLDEARHMRLSWDLTWPMGAASQATSALDAETDATIQKARSKQWRHDERHVKWLWNDYEMNYEMVVRFSYPLTRLTEILCFTGYPIWF